MMFLFESLSMKNLKLPFNVQERDIDLLILEQLHTSSSFVSWIAEKTGAAGAIFDDALHSVYRGNGETDVLLFLRAPEGRVAVMIEDKVGAPMQPRQCERYHERGAALCKEGKAVRYTTMLCAPDIYLRSVPDEARWQHRLSLEEIIAWFSSDTSSSAVWRRAILTAATSKSTRARHADDKSNREFDATLLSLKTDYRSFVGMHYAELLASEQTGRDREYYLRARTLPAGIRFKHSFFRGEISLIFERRWTDIAARHLKMAAPEGSWIVTHGSELHLRMPVEIMDPALPLDAQEETVSEALDGICRLIPLAERIVGHAD